MKLIRRLIYLAFCVAGLHRLRRRTYKVLDDGFELKERRCRDCGFSPTWER